MLCEKVNYISKNQAKKIRKHRSMKSKRVSVYKCPFCRYFHTANTKHMRKSKGRK